MLLNVLVSMMSAPAARYWPWISLIDVGARQDQQIVVALEILRVILEPLAAEVRLGQLVALDHRPHRAVEDEDALRERVLEAPLERCRCPRSMGYLDMVIEPL